MIALRSTLVLALAGWCVPLPAQELRVAIEEAPVVVVGRHRGVRPHGDYLLHKVAVVRALHGTEAEEVTVVEWKKLSFHVRPAIASTRLWCLHPVDGDRLGLPAGTYFRLDQHPGSHPPVDGNAPAGDPIVRFAELLIDAGRAGTIADRRAELVDAALTGPAPVRLEAARLLVERAVLLAALDPLELSKLLARAGAETEDVEYKIALATICAERRMPDLIDALALGWPRIDDESFSRALGRFARHLHGEDAAERLLPYLQRTRDPKLRGHVLLALGATSTESALEVLLRVRRLETDRAPVDAALRLHGSPRAIEAVDRR